MTQPPPRRSPPSGAAGVPTFVVGIPGSEAYATWLDGFARAVKVVYGCPSESTGSEGGAGLRGPLQ